MKKQDFFPSTCINYRILLAILVANVYVEKYFKTKIHNILLKINYDTRRLSGFAIIYQLK